MPLAPNITWRNSQTVIAATPRVARRRRESYSQVEAGRSFSLHTLAEGLGLGSAVNQRAQSALGPRHHPDFR